MPIGGILEFAEISGEICKRVVLFASTAGNDSLVGFTDRKSGRATGLYPEKMVIF